MKRMTKLAFGAVLAAGLALAPQADAQSEQQGRPERPGRGERLDPAQRIERRVSMLTERLQLSEQQAAQIRQILTEESTQMRALFDKAEGGGADRESLRPQVQSLREGSEKKIDAVLTAQQRTTYAQLREEMRKRRDERGEGRRPRGEGQATRRG
jgi:Spy/CpxP family protein refolding chaperone